MKLLEIQSSPRGDSITLSQSFIEPAYTIDTIASRAGKSEACVYGRIRLADLLPPVAEAFLKDQITIGHPGRAPRRSENLPDLPRGVLGTQLVRAKWAWTNSLGDPMKEGIKIGPLATSGARKNLHRQVLDAVKAGARILTGGEIPAGPGNFYPPTVLVGLPPEAAIAKEEFFGPMAMIFPFKSEEEAIRLANITDFGLSAAVWSRDLVRARRVAGEIESGTVFINDFTRTDPRAPFGGFKASGYGRELGAPGARELTNSKVIWQAA